MLKTKVYNLEGKAIGDIELSDKVFGVKVKPAVVHQVFVQQTNNQREPWADTKSKGEVRGGGKKPWKQKGTGRARHGSSRSPIWKGGGVVFGPRTDRNYKTKINTKTRQLAIRMCLSDKAQTNHILVVENLKFTAPKTKLLTGLLKSLPKFKNLLLLTAGKDEMVLRMAENLPKVKVWRAEDVNVMELLSKDTVLATKDGIAKMEQIFAK
ncbi:MAG: 50S ribosomal protein L4 [Candidatus Magasanikbacteria bacterium RIFOXYA2_FULL_44_8]|uniref:Large ribosomal subunit protein uL4 n=1 Tax=Candidatus Magasanikbacteria bacterium RIFOXYA2_FULL_44_8 TaxID=1798696 RepID=A0A1F6NKR6_9BACT|nr:MAG: 50S ribosomal protein L4 [Candidatus Magasanikbacteria bacterium RIFOXYA2_FULL_44_8]